MEDRKKAEVPHKISFTGYLKDTDSNESFGQSFGGTPGPELVFLQT